MNGLCEASERPERALTALHALLNYSHHGWCCGWCWCGIRVYKPKFKADKAMTMAGLTLAGRVERVHAGRVLELEYLEHRRRAWALR